MADTLYIPARSAAGAEATAYAIDAGTVRVRYLTPQAAIERAAELGRPGAAHHAYEVERVAKDDGWIRVARLINRVGEIAAAFVLTCALPAIAAAFWGVIA